MEEAVQHGGGSCRQIRMAITLNVDGERREVAKLRGAHCQEKPLGRGTVPVP